MNRCLLALCFVALCPPLFAADVGVSVTIGDPSYYGRIDIGNVATPRLVYQRPIIIQAPTVVVQQQPIYLHVPPGHEKKWSKHCAQYHACGKQVYFVQNGWYSNVYVPYYRNHKGGKGDKGRRDESRGRDDGNNDDHDNGHGKGHGKGKK